MSSDILLGATFPRRDGKHRTHLHTSSPTKGHVLASLLLVADFQAYFNLYWIWLQHCLLLRVQTCFVDLMRVKHAPVTKLLLSMLHMEHLHCLQLFMHWEQRWVPMSESGAAKPLLTIPALVFLCLACLTPSCFHNTTLKSGLEKGEDIDCGKSREARQMCETEAILVTLKTAHSQL